MNHLCADGTVCSSSVGEPDPCLRDGMCCYETESKTGRNKESGFISLYLKLGSDQAKNARFVSVTEPRTAVLCSPCCCCCTDIAPAQAPCVRPVCTASLEACVTHRRSTIRTQTTRRPATNLHQNTDRRDRRANRPKTNTKVP